MTLLLSKSRKKSIQRMFVAAGIAVIGWATFQSEGIASGEFLTDRIGEGSVLQLRENLSPEFDGRYVYFQNGHPVQLTHLQADVPYCRFKAAAAKLSKHFDKDHKLVVRFRNVARARWFFDQGLELECMSAADQPLLESDFEKTMGRFIHLEKHHVFATEAAL